MVVKVSVVSLFKDNADYINQFVSLCERMEAMYANRLLFSYYIYENNSTDATKILLCNFMKTRPGMLICENVEAPKTLQGVDMERGVHMAELRNNLKQHHGRLTTDSTVFIDSGAMFHYSAVGRMLDRITQSNGDIVMVTPFSICWKAYLRRNNRQSRSQYHYYDSLAFITSDGIGFEENGNTCMFESCRSCITARKKRGITRIDDAPLLRRGSVIPVRSAFGSMCAIETRVYNEVSWDHTICEHHSFCENVGRHGRIVCDTTIPIVVTDDRVGEEGEYGRILVLLDNLNR